VHVELAGVGEGRQNVTFQIVAVEGVERTLVHHEESRIDPVVRKSGLLDEAADAPSLV
jgi:hypothetical protein